MITGAFLRKLTGLLERAGIPYMIVGSLASTYHGQPRTTQDVDVVIDPTAQSLQAFLGLLPVEDYYSSREAALDALKRRGMFNVIDNATGWKVDLIIRKARPFSVEEFTRRSTGQLLGEDVQVASAEDTILAKLEWAKLGQSERQERDVADMISVRGDSLDYEYIEHWARVLGVEEVWRRLRQENE